MYNPDVLPKNGVLKNNTKEKRNVIVDNLKIAEFNTFKNVQKTKPLEKIDWSINKKIEKRVKKISIDLKNVQVLCLNKNLFIYKYLYLLC